MALNKATNGNTTTLVEYNNVLGRFTLTADKAAVKSVAATFGDSWKKGFTGRSGTTAEARKALDSQGVALYESLSGALTSVRYDRGEFEGKTFPKIRVTLADQGNVMLSIPLDGDAAAPVLAKLGATAPGTVIDLKIFSSINERGYTDIGVSVKSGNVEIQGTPGFFKSVGEISKTATSALTAAGIEDKSVLAGAARAARTKFLRAELAKIEAQYAAPAAASTDSSEPASEAAMMQDIGY